MKAVMEMERVIRSFAISSFEGKEMEFKLPEQDLTEDVMYPNDPVRKLTGFLQWVMAHIRMHHISHMNTYLYKSFPHKSPMNSGSFVESDLPLECAISPIWTSRVYPNDAARKLQGGELP